MFGGDLIRAILAIPAVYRIFSHVLGANTSRLALVEQYIRAKDGDQILDIGCGPADILEYLPRVEYIGFDLSQHYIDSAKERFGDRGTFLCENVSNKTAEGLPLFDTVLALGILHHLNDEEAVQLFKLAQSVLRPGGKLVSFDGCYTEEQSRATRYILSRDRGQYVRNGDGYLGLASKVFGDIKADIRHDLLNIPYTHIILECYTSGDK